MVLKNETAKYEIYNTMKGMRSSFSAIKTQFKKFPLGMDTTQPRDELWLKKQIKLPILDGFGSAHQYKQNLANKLIF
jgi:hypothetical protein